MFNHLDATEIDQTQSFAFGFTDGLKDFFVQPMVGAQKEGAKGFAKGVGKGIGNVICKPAAGKYRI